MSTMNFGDTYDIMVGSNPFVHLNHLEFVDVTMLDSIIDGSWGILSLNGLTNLTPEICAVLSRHQGVLSLAGITSLDVDSARNLVRHHGTMLLENLHSITPEVAGIFAESDETIVLGLSGRVHTEVTRILTNARGVIGYIPHTTQRVTQILES